MKEINSPYAIKLKSGKVKWQQWSKENLEKARVEKRIIFLHTGRFSESINRNKAIQLFENNEISQYLNDFYMPIYIDPYSNSELYYTLLDLGIIIEQKVSSFVNVILLPDKILKPLIAFSSLEKEEVLEKIVQIKELYNNKYDKLALAGKYLLSKLQNSGIVTNKEPAIELNDKILHKFVRNWSYRFTDKDYYQNKKPYTFNARFFIFLIKYGVTYNAPKYREKIEESLLNAYYSPMFDPIEGGMFRQASDSSLKEPLYELDLNENIQLISVYAIGYKYYKNPIYKEVYEKIFNCIEQRFKRDSYNYINSISTIEDPRSCTYYKYSLKELKENFPTDYIKIAKALKMDIKAKETHYQVISNTPEFSFITDDQLATLKQIRKTRKKQLIKDNSTIIGYNTLLASALCLLFKYEENADKKEFYLNKAGSIIDNVLKIKLLKKSNYTLQDYSLLINSLINYAINTNNGKYKGIAREYVSYVIANFYQITTGVFSNSNLKSSNILYKREGIMDYFKFSANAIMARNMFLMYKYTGSRFFLEVYEQLLYNIEPHLYQSGPLMASWANELLNYLNFEPLQHNIEENCLRNSKI